MTPRPIHKWKTLWLGLLVLVFLTWGWKRSLGHDDYICIRPTSVTLHGIGSGSGYITWYSATMRGSSVPPSRGFDYGSIAMKKIYPWFPKPARYVHSDDTSFSTTYRSIAYWLIILIYLASSITFLLWRRKKAQRLTASPLQAAPEPTP